MPIAPDARNDFPPMETERLELSFGTPDDAALLFPFVHGEEGRPVTDTLLWDGPDVVEDMTRFFDLHETGTFAEDGFHWVLRDRIGEITGEPRVPIGAIGLEPGKHDDECEIGYWLAPPYWGQGLMAEAITAGSYCAARRTARLPTHHCLQPALARPTEPREPSCPPCRPVVEFDERYSGIPWGGSRGASPCPW